MLNYSQVADKFLSQVDKFKSSVSMLEEGLFVHDVIRIGGVKAKQLKVYLFYDKDDKPVFACPANESSLSASHVSLFIDGEVRHILASEIKFAIERVVQSPDELSSSYSFLVIDRKLVNVHYSPLRKMTEVGSYLAKLLRQEIQLDDSEWEFIDAVRMYQSFNRKRADMFFLVELSSELDKEGLEVKSMDDIEQFLRNKKLVKA